MLFKGKHDGYYLYELTDTDLIWEDTPKDHYLLGNVLLFDNKNNIALGSELVKADDLDTALSYLELGLENASFAYHSSQDPPELLQQQLADAKASIGKRDELLRDLTSDLESQRYSNRMLIAQLENLREQVSIEKVTRNEVLGDLEYVSAETYRKDQELEKAIDAKNQLEQELAARICELLELDSANADLQKRLEQRDFDESGPLQKHSASPTHIDQPDSPIGMVYTMPSGKQIHIYHEFTPTNHKSRKRMLSALRGFLRFFLMIFIGGLVFLAGSVIATARLNSLTWGEALDITLKALFP